MINVMYNSLSFNNCVFSGILCNGDGDDSSLIYYNTINNNNNFSIENSIIKNCKTNGDLIKVKGDITVITFFNFSVINNSIYGSFINNESLNVNKKNIVLLYLYINN